MTELGPAPSDDAIASAIQRAVELGTMEGMKDHGSIARAMREAFRVAAARR
jgi:hypothetical protein